MTVKRETIELIRRVEGSMVEEAASTFSESELDHLRTVVSFTIEFFDFIESADTDSFNTYDRSITYELRYNIESIFAGIESYTVVNASYKVLVGATRSRVNWENVSISALRERFIAKYHDFMQETNFENKCRLLLDLFKIQIVFAGMLYD
jgi:hypothetical protein